MREPYIPPRETYGQALMRMAANKQYYEESRARFEARKKAKAKLLAQQREEAKRKAARQKASAKASSSYMKRYQHDRSKSKAYRLKNYMNNIRRLHEASGYSGSVSDYMLEQGYHNPTGWEYSMDAYMDDKDLPRPTKRVKLFG